jgi:flagellar motor switch protein FliN
MKTILLLEILEDSVVKRHSFQEHDSNIFTLLVDLSGTRNEFSIELIEGETTTSYGTDNDISDLQLNQLAHLKKEGANILLNLKDSGVHYFYLDMSNELNPMLRIQAENQDSNQKGTGLEHFLNSRLPVTFEVGKTEMSIHDVLSLGQGSIIELHRMVGEALSIYVGEELVAKGEVVVTPDNTFGARVVKVLPIAGEMNKMFNLNVGESS